MLNESHKPRGIRQEQRIEKDRGLRRFNGFWMGSTRASRVGFGALAETIFKHEWEMPLLREAPVCHANKSRTLGRRRGER
jgi:hypothetical protein